MGKDRDELIRRLGSIRISDLNLTDEEIERLARETYTIRGEIPPDIRNMIEEWRKGKE